MGNTRCDWAHGDIYDCGNVNSLCNLARISVMFISIYTLRRRICNVLTILFSNQIPFLFLGETALRQFLLACLERVRNGAGAERGAI